ncbi:unnamed protein product [Somion occarium]|uniref:F-box domain-containing protein n=1 Tax=Somion occarium TaxID=3059160 RepID=A0ABP1ECS2_9APHY
MTSIVDLPSEILEAIIVNLSGSPLSIAALSKTCRRFLSLIYETPDHHLWRTVFLSRYDDPRLSDRLNLHSFDKSLWRNEYTSRAWAAEQLQATDISETDKSLGLRLERFSSALDAISRLCTSANPQSPILTRDGTSDSSSSSHALAHDKTIYHAYRNTSRIVRLADTVETLSLNLQQLKSLTDGGCFHLLLHWLCPPYRQTAEDATQSACKLLAFLGTRHTSASGLEENPFKDPLCKAALKYARRRAYDMDYPVKARKYGPFVRHRRQRFTADWIQLAAIRLLCEEAALEEHSTLFLDLTELGRLRPGAWVPDLRDTHHEVANINESHAMERDWAGVEGVWRRLVVWLGYDNLINFNADMKNDDIIEDAQVYLIVPLRLRIVSYKDEPDGSPLFPTIQCEGEMGGQGWDTSDEEQADVHHVEGSVSMLADGSVRWSLTSYMDYTNEEKQWATEGVQIGGIGSMAGILGTWTGAYHEPDDPIGGWWQWKVG